MRGYLQSHGWAMLEEPLSARIYAFSNGAFPGRQLVYPMDFCAPDYDEAIALVVRKLAGLTGATIDSIITELLDKAK